MRSKLWIDFETSGLDFNIHSPLQVAMMSEVDGKIIGEWNVSIRQHPIVCSPEAMEITGIDINAPGLTFPEFRKEYWDRINRWFYGGTDPWGRPVIKPTRDNMPLFSGYNTTFDRPWLHKILGSTWDGIFFHRCDPMILATTLWDIGILERGADFKLGTLCQILGVKVESKLHDALVDIKATRECYEVMKGIINGRIQESQRNMEKGLGACL
jgi:DNA polymerase III epsilon subunit-like protein